MKKYRITLIDAERFKVEVHIESGSNVASLELLLNGTLGMAGCEIMKIEEYQEVDY